MEHFGKIDKQHSLGSPSLDKPQVYKLQMTSQTLICDGITKVQNYPSHLWVSNLRIDLRDYLICICYIVNLILSCHSSSKPILFSLFLTNHLVKLNRRNKNISFHQTKQWIYISLSNQALCHLNSTAVVTRKAFPGSPQ